MTTSIKKLLPEYNALREKHGKPALKEFDGSSKDLKRRIDVLRAKKSLIKKSTPEKKAVKPEVDKNLITVVDVANEMNMDPKVARAKLRRSGLKANEGRWPQFKRDSAEHKKFIEMLQPNTKKAQARKAEKK